MCIQKIKNEEAIKFYDELLKKQVVESNDEMRTRLSEVQNWQNAFVTLMNNASYFQVKVLKKNKLSSVLKKYKFEKELCSKLLN